MKNMIEVPSEKDFYKTTNIEITHDDMSGVKKVHYRKCCIAMRSITDFTSCEMEFDVMDEEKIPEFEKEMIEFQEKCKNYTMSDCPIERPQPPTKKVLVTGTIISYYNTAQRIIIDHFEDFEEKYFSYLKAQRLDI